MMICSKCRREIRPGERFVSYDRIVQRLEGGAITVDEAESLRWLHPRCDRRRLLRIGGRR